MHHVGGRAEVTSEGPGTRRRSEDEVVRSLRIAGAVADVDRIARQSLTDAAE